MIGRNARSGLLLAAGDVAAFLLFTLAGRLEHRMNPLAPHFFETALSFALPWLAAASAFGLFRPSMLLRPWTMASRVTVAWAIACPVGLFVRAWLLERNVSYLFGAVTFGLMLALLLLWRLPWVVAARAGRGRSA